MPTLRIEADYIVTSEGGSTTGVATYEEGVAYGAAYALTALGGADQLEFVKHDPAGDVYSGVRIYKDYGTPNFYAQIVSDWLEWDVLPEILLNPTHSISPGGTYVSEVPLPADVHAAIKAADHVFYFSVGGSGPLNLGVTSGTNPTTGAPTYTVAYGFYSATNSNIRGFLSGDGQLFDSSVNDPDPYDWGSEHCSELVWGTTPDIFWTQRVLCEETQS